MSKHGRKNGFYHTEETKKKISKTLTGRVKSPEHREKISKALKGRIPANKKLNQSLLDELFELYGDSYENEEIGIWLNKNKEEIIKSKIKSEHQVTSSRWKEIPCDIGTFENQDLTIEAINPETIMILNEEI